MKYSIPPLRLRHPRAALGARAGGWLPMRPRCRQREPRPALVAVLEFRRPAHVSGNAEARRAAQAHPCGQYRRPPIPGAVQLPGQRSGADRHAQLLRHGLRVDAHRRPRGLLGRDERRVRHGLLHGPKTRSTSGQNPARIPFGPEFKIGAIENKLVNWAAQGPAGYMASTFGGQIVQSQLASGFTVIHADSGDEFALGQLQPPQHPPQPFNLPQRRTLRLRQRHHEVRSEQIDMLGPFRSRRERPSAILPLSPDRPEPRRTRAAPRRRGSLAQRACNSAPRSRRPPEAPLMQFPLMAGQEQHQKIPLPPGQYYIVLDNSSKVGTVNPPWNPLGVVGGNTAVVAHRRRSSAKPTTTF